ncbi:MAG TPA: glycosyltransferase [Candidatus Synoicihabitans sp.]|nr:glycosyltransferase [Candidatus Synoicihabitans sp.]
MPPEVSIVMPVRDAAATLPRALSSVAAQTCTDWELVVVDDGSSDGTPAILAEWSQREPRLRVLPQAREGIVAALTKGLDAARGCYVARLDADDEMAPARLERQVAALRADASLGLVACLVTFGGDRTERNGYATYVDWLNALVTPEDIVRNRFVESPLAHPSVMFRRELVNRFGGYTAGDFPEDYELWLRWLEAGVRMAKVPEPLLVWHDSPGRLSRTDSRYATEAFYRLKARYLARATERLCRGRALWVWGAGRPTRKRVRWLRAEGATVAGYIDIDPRKTGRIVEGVPVVAAEELPAAADAFVLGYVGTRGARDLIRARLVQQRFREGADFLMAA